MRGDHQISRGRPRSVVALTVLLLVLGAQYVQVVSPGAAARETEIEEARLVGFDSVAGMSLRLFVDAGYCADDLEPRPAIDHVKIVERGRTSRWPKGYVLVTAFTRREVPPEEGPTCKPFGGTLSVSVKLRRPVAGLAVLDGSRRPPQRIPSIAADGR